MQVSNDTAKKKHDLNSAILSLTLLNQMIQDGYQFNDDNAETCRALFDKSTKFIATEKAQLVEGFK